MSATTSLSSTNTLTVPKAILWGGFVAGVLDAVDGVVAFGLKGLSPIQVLQYIASGLLGPKSFDGGWQTALFGTVLHFGIAFSAAGVFYGASRKLLFLKRRPVLSGVLYGIAVYVFMYWVVLPLSAYHKPPFSISATIMAIVTHIVCVGLPISLIVDRYSSR